MCDRGLACLLQGGFKMSTDIGGAGIRYTCSRFGVVPIFFILFNYLIILPSGLSRFAPLLKTTRHILKWCHKGPLNQQNLVSQNELVHSQIK